MDVSFVTASPLLPHLAAPSPSTHCSRAISGELVYHEKIPPPCPSEMNSGYAPN
jgi:hypothetical protein